LGFVIVEILINLSLFFDDLLLKVENMKAKYSLVIHVLAQVIYNAILAFLIGVIITIIGIIIVISFFQQDINTSITTYLIIPSFIFACLTAIVFLNIKNPINLPRFFLTSTLIVLLLNPIKRIRNSILFLILTTIILAGIMSPIIATMSLPENQQLKIFAYFIVGSFLITIILYSETALAEETRLLRQFSLWVVMFIILLVANGLKLNSYIEKSNDYSVLNESLLLVTGLAFTLIRIVNKGRNLYCHFTKKFERSVSELWGEAGYTLTLQSFKDKLSREKEELALGLKNTRNQWVSGQKFEVLQSFALAVLGLVIWITLIMNMELFQVFFESALKKLGLIWVTLFDGDKNLATIVFTCILIIGGLSYSTISMIRKFEESHWNQRFFLMGRTLLSLLLLAVLVIGQLFKTATGVYRYILIVLLIANVIIWIAYKYTLPKIKPFSGKSGNSA